MTITGVCMAACTFNTAKVSWLCLRVGSHLAPNRRASNE